MEKNFPKNVLKKGRVRVCLELVSNQAIKGKIILDIGSSFGWLEKELIKLKPKKIIGVEMDARAVEFSKKNVKEANFVIGSALKIHVDQNFADIVILFDVLEHVPKGSEREVFKEISRVLKKDGVLLFSTPNSNFFSNIFDIAWYFGHRHYSVEYIVTMLKSFGFRVISQETKGSVLSSIYLTWFYIMKRLTGKPQPRNSFFEKLDDKGYQGSGLTDIFILATKN